MVNPGDAPAAPQQQAAENQVKSEFLEKMSEIPVVNSAKEYSTAVYNQVKGYNKFTAAALSAAETTALYLAITAKPFLEKIQPQAQAIDNLACKGLSTVEQNMPFIMKPPEDLILEARDLATSTLEIGLQKAEDIKTYGTETLETVKNYGMEKVNKALDETETFIDKYIPPPFGEGSQEAASESSSVPEKATKLTSKIGLRLYGHSIKQIMPIHNLSEDAVSKLSYALELLVQLRENVKNKSLQEHVDEAKVKATWIWEELNKEPAEPTEAEKSLEQRILSFARRTTSVLVHAYSKATVPLSAFPVSYQDGMEKANKYALELFKNFDQATNAGEITVGWLQTIRQNLSSFEELISKLKAEEIEMENLVPEPEGNAPAQPPSE